MGKARIVKGHNRAFLPGDLTCLGVFLIGCSLIGAGNLLRKAGRR